MRAFLILLAGLLAFAGGARGAEEDHLRLVPFPKEARLQAGAFSLAKPLVLEVSAASREIFSTLLNEELTRAGLPAANVRELNAPAPAFRLTAGGGPLVLPNPPAEGAPEGYALAVRGGEIVCAAKEAAGLFYGLQTLCQLIRANRQQDALPCLIIRDWPSLRWRCFQDDMTRGPSSTLETLKFEAGLGAYLKLNLMTFYMEHQYAFKKHSRIGPANGSLLPGELSALVDYVKPLHLDILGNQQSFGHFGAILRHPEYAAMRETADVLTPVREETYQLLDDLYAEVCPLVPFPWFNVCCDETDGLGAGPARELAAKIGVGGVYVRHIRRVHDLLRDKYHKRMMMWGDIILQHPDQLREVPKDTIMLTWGYDARANFENQILPFANSGYEFFVCPGVNNWSRILPDFGVAMTNIRNFVRDGVKHHALGMLNTDWEDDGEAINAGKWHSDAWAAECAWNASTTPPELFQRRVGAVLFGERGDHFGQAIELLAQTHRLSAFKGMFNARFWENDFAPKGGLAAIPPASSNLLALARPAIEHLEACRREARCNQPVLDAILFGARRMEWIGRRMRDGLEAARSYEALWEAASRPGSPPGAAVDPLAGLEQLVQKNREECAALGRQFAALWLAESKPYALDWTLQRYTNAVSGYDDLLKKLAAARASAAAGRPLPAPEEIGLFIPKPLSRQARPARTISEPLAAETPWADPAATHRLGLIIRAGAADRVDLPVEVELALPEALAAKPARAFWLPANQEPRELLAQLDPLGGHGKSRLVLILPGPLKQGAEARVQVYLGLPKPPPAMPGAVGTRPGSNGMQWLENDQVRLLLGPEGAHLYRWEIKAAGNRDLTMPGETGWAGFCDLVPYRNSSYRLDCSARGPAMVEYQCADGSGHLKTIRLYGGASWVEVLLSEPAPHYWDFDNPKNFAADGPTPGAWLFSNGQSGPVGREADGVLAQVREQKVFWGVKYNIDKYAIGLITPEVPAFHHVAPGAGAGGVGIESSPAAMHFVTFAGLLQASPAETMNRLQATLDLKRPVEVRMHALQAR